MITSTAEAYRRDRLLVLSGILVLSFLAWLAMLESIAPSRGDHHTIAMTVQAWDQSLLALSTLMWSIMMIAMMLPSATPVVLGFMRVQHRRSPATSVQRVTWIFVGGYLLAWSVFSALAALLQWSLHGMGFLSSSMGSVSPLLASGFLLLTGIFQLSAMKEACLTKCRSPLNFLLNAWRDGRSGAFLMGLHHGAYCIGCCWLLMLLMFVGGVMNLTWMAGIAVYVLLEKAVPRFRLAARLTGVMLIATGVLSLALTLVDMRGTGGL